MKSLIDSLQQAKTLKDLQSIASQIGIAPKTKPLPPDQYARKKKREAARQRKKSRDSRDIAGTCPECEDTKIRDRIVKDLKYALETLWPDRFAIAWSQDHLDFIQDTKDTILSGGQLARAMPRGTGKTSILICAIIWAILCGRHTFAVLIAATSSAAEELLEQIRTEFETNDRIYAYFPELVHPIRKLEGIRQRRLLWDGNRTNRSNVLLNGVNPMPKAKTAKAPKQPKPKLPEIASYDAKTEKPKGRPAGSPNRLYDIVEAEPTRCRRCGSDQRSEYQKDPKKLRQAFAGVVKVTVWRRCKCLKCGQWRKDRFRHTETIDSSG